MPMSLSLSRMSLGSSRPGGGGGDFLISGYSENLASDPPTFSFTSARAGTWTWDFHSLPTAPAAGAGDIATGSAAVSLGVNSGLEIDLSAYPGETGYIFHRVTDGGDVSNVLRSGIITTAAGGIQYVGGVTYSQSLGNGTFNISGLTGGIGSAPIEGDLVFVAVATASNTNRTFTVASTGWTSTALTFADDSNDTNGRISWKIMGPTPDTDFSMNAPTVGSSPMAVIIQVYRGVDPVTPLDTATPANPEKASGTNTRIPDPGSITPTTTGSRIVVFAASAMGTSQSDVLTASYLSDVTSLTVQNSYSVATLMGSVTWTSGAYDPAALTISNSTTSDSWSTTTIAFKPA